jgi:UDP-N-acetylmuramoylalanine-D-glutamate ligase
MELSELKDKRILIVGLARTGVSLAHLLVEKGADVTVSDHKSKAELSNYLEKLDKGGATRSKTVIADLLFESVRLGWDQGLP